MAERTAMGVTAAIVAVNHLIRAVYQMGVLINRESLNRIGVAMALTANRPLKDRSPVL